MDHSKKIDKLSEEMLEKYIIKTFEVAFAFQYILGMHSVHIKYSFITPPTKLYKMYFSIVWLVNSLCTVECVLSCRTKFFIPIIDQTLHSGIMFNSLMSTYLAWRSVFCDGYKKSQIFVKLQKIDRCLKIKNAVKINMATKTFRVSLIVAVVTIASALVWLYLFTVNLMKVVTLSFFITSVLSVASVTNAYLIIMIIYFISVRTKYLHDAITRKDLHISDEQNHQDNIFTVAIDKTEQISDDSVKAMFYILDSFSDLMDVYQLTILLYIFQTVWWQLISTENLVATLRIQMKLNFVSFFGTFPYAVYFMTFAVVMCRVTNSFNDTLESCRRACSAIVTAPTKGKSRENAKRMILLIEGRRDATVFNILKLDTRLPLHLVAISASYTIVLLQLAVL